MDKSDAERAIARMDATWSKAAQVEASRTIGDAVLALHAQGLDVTIPALIEHLVREAGQASGLRRAQYEAAARALGWGASAASPPTA